MRGLQGDFGTMPLKDLVSYLGNRRASGKLSLERKSTKKNATIKDGRVIAASSNEAREFLGQFLINMGHISEEQFHRAYETQRETKVFLGKILVMTGAVDEQTLRTALSLKFRETLLEAFEWSEGIFRFESGAPDASMEGMEFEIELLDLHREGEFRETAWQAIRAVFPSGDVRLDLFEHNFPEPPQAGSLDDRLVGLIRQGMTIDELKLALHATDFFLFQRLYALYRLEVIRPAAPREADLIIDEDEEAADEPVQGEELTMDELVAAARFALDEGNFAEAETLARRAHEQNPTSDTANLVAAAEAKILALLRESLMVRGVRPRLLIDAGKLKTLKLTAPERYLLSRADGQREVHSIVTVAPIRELEALKLLHRFIEQGWISIA